MRQLVAILAAVMALSLAGCGYSTFQPTDEQVQAGWSDAANQYRRRADLIPFDAAPAKSAGLGVGASK